MEDIAAGLPPLVPQGEEVPGSSGGDRINPFGKGQERLLTPFKRTYHLHLKKTYQAFKSRAGIVFLENLNRSEYI